MDIPISAQGKLLSAGRLFLVATGAYERLKVLSSSTSGGKDDALIIIVFCAAALEAFLNELPELLSMFPAASGSEPPQIASYVDLVKEVEANNGSIKLKYLLAYSVLSGQPCEKGEIPYQDFSLLVDIRNELLHGKPRNVSSVTKPDGTIEFGPQHKILGRLRDKGILDKSQPTFDVPVTNAQGAVETRPIPIPLPWHYLVATKAAGNWACETVATVVESLLKVVPDSQNKPNLQQLCKTFNHTS